MTAVSASMALRPAERAELIYAQARSGVANRLWQAALGSDTREVSAPAIAGMHPDLDLQTLLAVMGLDPASRPVAAPLSALPLPDRQAATPDRKDDYRAASSVPGLGPNEGHRATIDAAAGRTGIPAGAIAAIIDAEAAKDGNGRWQVASRNPRSTARGLGQFLAGTWKSEAERAGTWLNVAARRQGWLDSSGRVLPTAREALLALRGDAEASINAAADYARQTIVNLREAGIDVGNNVTAVAQAVYVGHNLGAGDAIRFFGGGLDNVRAKLLLAAQVGATSAARRIDMAASPAAAHRTWLLGYVERHINPNRFGI